MAFVVLRASVRQALQQTAHAQLVRLLWFTARTLSSEHAGHSRVGGSLSSVGAHAAFAESVEANKVDLVMLPGMCGTCMKLHWNGQWFYSFITLEDLAYDLRIISSHIVQ